MPSPEPAPVSAPPAARAPRDDVAELGALAHGLARLARRRRALGERRTAAAPAVPAAPAAPAAPEVPVAGLETRAVAPTGARIAPFASQIRPHATHERGANDAAPNDRGANDSAAAGLRRVATGCGDLASLAAAVEACRACPLGATRNRSVFADGAGAARVLFVGEAPGYHEDQRGVPFVGEAGRLLTDIITKGMGLDRARDVTICNVLKCRPPENRDPLPEEKALCTGWLERQIELVDPRLIIALGRHAAGHLLGLETTLGRMRGRVHERAGRPVIVTYHPAYLLRNPADKKACWQDIQRALGVLGLPVPGRSAPSEGARDDAPGP